MIASRKRMAVSDNAFPPLLGKSQDSVDEWDSQKMDDLMRQVRGRGPSRATATGRMVSGGEYQCGISAKPA